MKLSFIMIVKNGEKTIGKALESIKDITFEQIVVDTGSTDRTVEIARELGADVYHFEWIDDFAAARNFSIDQASGDWILGLDADEYFLPEDTQKLLEFLKQTLAQPKKREKIKAISCMAVSIDDNGRPMTKNPTLHLFRNHPSIRFTGRIHEQLSIDISEIEHAGDISLYHTGYSQATHKETGKAERNIKLLRAELENDPSNINLKVYLANSLSISTGEEHQTQAEELYNEILSSDALGSVHITMRVKMHIFFINKYLNEPGKIAESEEMCRRALADIPECIDFWYFLAMVLSKKGEHQAAWELLKKCEAKLIEAAETNGAIVIPADPTVLFGQMILTAQKLNDLENVVLYSTHVLSLDKTRHSVLSPLIATLLHYGVTEEETVSLLSNIYDFNDNDELAFVAAAARNCGATAFADRLG